MVDPEGARSSLSMVMAANSATAQQELTKPTVETARDQSGTTDVHHAMKTEVTRMAEAPQKPLVPEAQYRLTFDNPRLPSEPLMPPAQIRMFTVPTVGSMVKCEVCDILYDSAMGHVCAEGIEDGVKIAPIMSIIE